MFANTKRFEYLIHAFICTYIFIVAVTRYVQMIVCTADWFIIRIGRNVFFLYQKRNVYWIFTRFYNLQSQYVRIVCAISKLFEKYIKTVKRLGGRTYVFQKLSPNRSYIFLRKFLKPLGSHIILNETLGKTSEISAATPTAMLNGGKVSFILLKSIKRLGED